MEHPDGKARFLRLALLGYGNVGKAFAHLLRKKRGAYPFRIAAIHTARHGTAYDPHGLPVEPEFGPPAASVQEFLQKSRADILVEITTLNPATGEPALTHIRTALTLGLHVVTANKGPIAFAYHELCHQANQSGLHLRFESTTMDGTPVFNMVRNNLPGVTVQGFAGALNSTTKVVIAAMRRGQSFDEGCESARKMGIAEADARFDTDGWDSAAKTAALANVLMDAKTTPLAVDRRGIGKLTPERVQDLAKSGKTVVLVSRAKRTPEGVKLRVRAEVLPETDLLSSVHGSSNLLLLHTDLMGTVGAISIDPGVDQTAYGLFSDIVDIARSL